MKYRIKIYDRYYQAEIKDLNTRPILVNVDGVQIEIWPEEYSDLVPISLTEKEKDHKAAPSPTSPHVVVPTYGSGVNVKEIRAPIPGVIKEVLVKPGEEVIYGQELCIIEAMKMRNAIRSTRVGTLAEIAVSPGQTVNHNDTLMTFAD